MASYQALHKLSSHTTLQQRQEEILTYYRLPCQAFVPEFFHSVLLLNTFLVWVYCGDPAKEKGEYDASDPTEERLI
jgi:hypothetical protein